MARMVSGIDVFKRRQLLGALLAVLALVVSCHTPTEPYDPSRAIYVPPAFRPSGFAILDTFVIHGEHHSAFPRAVVLPTGEVLVVFRQGAEHLSKDGRLMLARVVRDSTGWRVAQTTVMFDTELDERNFGIARLHDGTLIVNVCSEPGYNGGASQLAVLRSGDQGLSWPDQVSYTMAQLPGNSSTAPLLATNSAVLELNNGELIMPADGIEHGSNAYSAHLLRSLDHGRHWFYDRVIARDSAGVLGFAEPALSLTGDGTQMAFRTSGVGRAGPAQDGFVFLSRSDANAKNWTAPEQEAFWGFPPNLLRTRHGTLIMSFGYRQEPQGVAFRVSHDDGHTWETVGDGRLATDGQGLDTGYPSTVELPDGTFFTAYYLYRVDRGVYVKGIHWQLE